MPRVSGVLRDHRLEDPAFRAAFERQRREIDSVDSIVRMLDALREEHGLSKADLARAIGKNPASVRRLLTAPVNPELRTVVAIAEALDAEVQIVPRKHTRSRRRRRPRRPDSTSRPTAASSSLCAAYAKMRASRCTRAGTAARGWPDSLR